MSSFSSTPSSISSLFVLAVSNVLLAPTCEHSGCIVTATVDSNPTVVKDFPMIVAVEPEGSVSVRFRVVSEDLQFTSIYTIVISRASNNARLQGLWLAPAPHAASNVRGFSPVILDYSEYVNDASLVTVTAECQHSGCSKIEVSPATVKLSPREFATVIVTVVAEDRNTTLEYVVTVTRGDNDAALSGIAYIIPEYPSRQYIAGFVPGVSTYSISLENESNITLLPQCRGPCASVWANGIEISMESGLTATIGYGMQLTILFEIVAQDNATETQYTVVISRAWNDANLASLLFNSASNPNLELGVLSQMSAFFVDVEADPSFTVTPVCFRPCSVTLIVPPTSLGEQSKEIALSGIASRDPTSPSIVLDAGQTISVTVVVVAENKLVQRSYSVVVTRGSNDTALTSIGIFTPFNQQQYLVEHFDPNVLDCQTSVGGAPEFVVIPTCRGLCKGVAMFLDKKPISVNLDLSSSKISIPADSSATIRIHVTAEDGHATTIYSLLVSRVNNDATLSALSFQTRNVRERPVPGFLNSADSFSLEPNTADSIQFRPECSGECAYVTISCEIQGFGTISTKLNSGALSEVFPLALGNWHSFQIDVMARDLVSHRTITVYAYRFSRDATLSSLSFVTPESSTPHALTTFDPLSTGASINIASASSVSLVPVCSHKYCTVVELVYNGGSTFFFSNESSRAIVVDAGATVVVELRVKAEDPTASRTYRIVLVRASDNALLSAITLVPTPSSSATTSSHHNATQHNTTTPMSISLSLERSSLSYSYNLHRYPSANIIVTCAEACSDISLRANGHEYSSVGRVGSRSSAMPRSDHVFVSVLAGGSETVDVVVTAPDSVTKLTYDITLYRDSDDALLADLSVAPFLEIPEPLPSFNPTAFEYSFHIGGAPNATLAAHCRDSRCSSIVFQTNSTDSMPIVTAANANVAVIPIAEGATVEVEVVIVAQDGVTTSTYSIILTRASEDATLSGIFYGDSAWSVHTLVPNFHSRVQNYNLSIAYWPSVFLVPRCSAKCSAISMSVASQASSAATFEKLSNGTWRVNVPAGSRVRVMMHVTAEGGTGVMAYSFVFTRESDDALLSFITATSPQTSSATTSATTTKFTHPIPTQPSRLSVSSGRSSYITVTAFCHHINCQTIAVTDLTVQDTATSTAFVASGVPFNITGIAAGLNHSIIVHVTAQDGVATQAYVLDVYRDSDYVALSKVTIEPKNIPNFSVNVSPTASIVSLSVGGASSCRLTFECSGVCSSVILDRGSIEVLVAGTSSGEVALEAGVSRSIQVTLTAEDGITTRSYEIRIARASNNTLLRALNFVRPLFDGSNTTESIIDFNPNNLDQEIYIGPSEWTSLVPVCMERCASIQLEEGSGTERSIQSGGASPQVDVLAGEIRGVNLTVIADDGMNSETYSVKIRRASGDCSLASLKFAAVASVPKNVTNETNLLDASLASENSSLSITLGAIPSFSVIPECSHSGCTVKVNGTVVPSGNTSQLLFVAPGTNKTVAVEVTAEDGITSHVFLLEAARDSNDATLSHLLATINNLEPSFRPWITSYVFPLHANPQGALFVICNASECSSISVEGPWGAYSLHTPGAQSPNISVEAGKNVTAHVVVTAPDRVETRTYRVVLTRDSDVATISEIAVAPYGIAPYTIPGVSRFSSNYSTYIGSSANSSFIVTCAQSECSNIEAYIYGTNKTIESKNLGNGNFAFAPVPVLAGSTRYIRFVVTAKDRVSTHKYLLALVRASNDATLSSLSVEPEAGTLQKIPSFHPSTLSYFVDIASAPSAVIAVECTGKCSRIEIAGPGVDEVVRARQRSPRFEIDPGHNVTVLITVTDEAHVDSLTYLLTMRRASNEASLRSVSYLPIAPYAFSYVPVPSFASFNSESSISIGNATGINIDYVCSEICNVTCDGIPAPCPSFDVAAGKSRTIQIVSTAEDTYTTRSYSLTATRASADASLTGLSVRIGESNLLPLSDLSLSVVVNVGGAPNASFIPVCNSLCSNIQIEADDELGFSNVVESGAESKTVTIEAGSERHVFITVTAEDQLTMVVYRVTLIRASNLALMSDVYYVLPNRQQTRVPEFYHSVLSYSMYLGPFPSFSIVPKCSDRCSSMIVREVGGGSNEWKTNTTSESFESGVVLVESGANKTVEVVVWSEDGLASRTYNFTLRRASNNTEISTMVLATKTHGTIQSGSDQHTQTNPLRIGNDDEIRIGATCIDSNCQALELSGAKFKPTELSKPIQLSPGVNTQVVLRVIAEDGSSTSEYSIWVYRNSSDSFLSALKFNYPNSTEEEEQNVPEFSSSNPKTLYLFIGSHPVVSLRATCSHPDCAAVLQWVDGKLSTEASGTLVHLEPGQTVSVEIRTIAEDGFTGSEYKIEITRASNDSNLRSLKYTPHPGRSTPIHSFSQNVLEYSAYLGTAEAVSVEANCHDEKCNGVSIHVEGNEENEMKTGDAVSIASGGAKRVMVVVTAEDQITKTTYAIVFERASNDASLASLHFTTASNTKESTLLISFAPSLLSYSLYIGNASAVAFTPSCVSAKCASIVMYTGSATTGGLSVPPKSLSPMLGVHAGSTAVVVFVVTAEDGITKQNYAVEIRRASNDSTLTSLSLSLLGKSISRLNLTERIISIYMANSQTFALAPVCHNRNCSRISVAIQAEKNSSTVLERLSVENGGQSNEVAVAAGHHVWAVVVVVAEDEITERKYFVRLRRASNDAQLISLLLTTTDEIPIIQPLQGFMPNAQAMFSIAPTNSFSFLPTCINAQCSSIAITNSTSSGANATTVTVHTPFSNIPEYSIPDGEFGMTFTILVTAEDGITTKSYFVFIATHAASGSGNDIPNLAIDVLPEPQTADVVGSVRLLMEFSDWSPAYSLLFVLNFAELMHLPVSRVKIESLTSGSVIIAYRIAPLDTTGPGAFTLVTSLNKIINGGSLLGALVTAGIPTTGLQSKSHPEVVLPAATRPESLEFTVSGIRFSSASEASVLDREREMLLAQTEATITELDTRLNQLTQRKTETETVRAESQKQVEILGVRQAVLDRNARKLAADIDTAETDFKNKIHEKDEQLNELEEDFEWATTLGTQVGEALANQQESEVTDAIAPIASDQFTRIANKHEYTKGTHLPTTSAREISLAIGDLLAHLESVKSDLQRERDQLIANLDTFRESAKIQQVSAMSVEQSVDCMLDKEKDHLRVAVDQLAEIDADMARVQQRLLETEAFSRWVTVTTEARSNVLRKTVAKCDQVMSELELYDALRVSSAAAAARALATKSHN